MKIGEIAVENDFDYYQIGLEKKKYIALEWFIKSFENGRKTDSQNREMRTLFFQKRFSELARKCFKDEIVRFVSTENSLNFEREFVEFLEIYYEKMADKKATDKERRRAKLLKELEALEME